MLDVENNEELVTSHKLVGQCFFIRMDTIPLLDWFIIDSNPEHIDIDTTQELLLQANYAALNNEGSVLIMTEILKPQGLRNITIAIKASKLLETTTFKPRFITLEE